MSAVEPLEAEEPPRPAWHDWADADTARWVAASRDAQRLPRRIDDPDTRRRIAGVITRGGSA